MKDKLRKIITWILVFLLLVCGSYAFSDYTIEGNSVYVNDSKVFLSATPHTSYGQPIEISFLSKIYTGDINMIYGFPDDTYIPQSIERYSPHIEHIAKSYLCNANYDYNPTSKLFKCIAENSSILFEGVIDSYDLEKKEVYWTEEKINNWVSWNLDSEKVIYDLNGVRNWRFAKNIPIVQGTEYKARIKIKTPDYEAPTQKYWICIYPSSYNKDVRQANMDDKLYCLDPWSGSPPANGLSYYDMELNTTDLWGGHDLTGSPIYVSYYPTFNISGSGENYSTEYDNSKTLVSPDSWTGDTDFSLSFWISFNQSVHDFPLGSSENQYDDRRWIFSFDQAGADKIRVGCDEDISFKTFYSNSSFNLGEFYHVVWSRYNSTGNSYLYVNGSLDSETTSFCAGDISTADDMTLGSFGELNYFTGYLDEIRSYSKVLNSTEIMNLYNFGNITGVEINVTPPINITPANWREWKIGRDSSLNTSRFYKGVLDDFRVYEYAFSPAEVVSLYDGSYNLTEDNYKLNDVVTFGIQSFNGSDLDTDNSLILNYTIPTAIDYEEVILQGGLTEYSLRVDKILSLSNAESNLIYNGITYSPTKTNNLLNYNFSRYLSHDFLGGLYNNSLYFEYSLVGIDGETIYLNSSIYYQLIENINLFSCGDNSTDLALIFQILHETYLSGINQSTIEGSLTYWNSDNQSQGNKTYFIDETLFLDPQIGLVNETYTTPGGYSDTATATIETEFSVKQDSIITYFRGKGDTNPCTGRQLEIYLGDCGTGELIFQHNLTANSSHYEDRFSLSDYTDFLRVGRPYCVRDLTLDSVCLGDRSLTNLDYDGDILFFQDQKIGDSNYYRVSLSSILENPSKICISPGYASLNYNAILSYTGGVDGYLQRWFVFNETLTNVTTTKTLYNYNETDSTVTILVNLYENEYNLLPYILTHLYRYYPGEDLWRLVQMDYTDDLGKAIFHVREEDTDYKLFFFRWGVPIGSTDTLKFKCPTFSECEIDISVLGTKTEYTTLFEDVEYWTSPNILSLTALTNVSLQLETVSLDNKIDWFAIWTTYNGTSYKHNLSSLGGGIAELNFTLDNVTEPEQLRVYYEIKHLTKGTYTAYRDYWIYPHHSTPMFFNTMIFMSGNFNSFWLMFFSAIMTMGIVGLIASMGVGSMPILTVITLSVLGVFVYFAWFPWIYYIALLVPSIIMAFLMGGRE